MPDIPRSYEKDDFVFDPIHYLPLLERKTAALDQAAPLQGWDLPDEYRTLRRLLESRMGRRGKREFVQVLRLMENFSHQEVDHAVKDALRLGAISFDAVKHLLLCRLEGKPPRLDLDLYPYLPRVTVKTTSATDYMTLLVGEGSMSNRPTLLLEHHLKELRLPTFLREYRKLAAQCAAEGTDHPDYLLRLSELETHRPTPAHGRAPHTGRPFPRGQKPGYLRLPGHTLGEQGPGHGTGPV